MWPCQGHPDAYSRVLRSARERHQADDSVGQLRASHGCPVCGGENGGKWTCSPCTSDVNTLRELFRNLQAWHSLYEAREVEDTLTSAETGMTWTLFDVDYLYEQRSRLPQQMRVVIELYLYQNLLEEETAIRLGVARTNPVAIYATAGLTKLVAMAKGGELSGFHWESKRAVAA